MVTHGHTLDEDKMSKLIAKLHIHVLVTGHTHVPVVRYVDKAIHINPGSPAHPKLEREGVLIPTVGLISEGKASILEIDTGKEILSLPLM